MNATLKDLTKMTLAQMGRLSESDVRVLLETLRWPAGPVCVHCGDRKVVRINGASPKVRDGLLRCKACRKQFTVTVGSIFEDSHIPLRTWLLAIALMCSSKKGISALQLKRALGLGSYQTAWFLAHRIRYAMTTEPLRSLLNGVVEVDETYIGGKSRRRRRGRGSERKTPVMALVERGGRVRAQAVGSVSGKTLKSAIREYVRKDARLMTDEWSGYQGLKREFADHKTVKHAAGEYVNGEAHVNTAESFFALLKRGVHGTFHHISKRHLNRYCHEFGFRWDRRHLTDGQRTVAALQAAEGKRLTYRGLNGMLPVPGPGIGTG